MGAPDRFAFGGFVLDAAQKRVLRHDGTEVALTPRLFNALQLFVEHPGQLLEKDALLRTLWPHVVVEENSLTQVVSGLRRALGDDSPAGEWIQTVPRRGYRFVAPVSRLSPTGDAEAPAPAAAAVTGDPSWPAPVDPSPGDAGSLARTPERRRWLGLAAAGGAALAGGAAWWKWAAPPEVPPDAARVALAVLPFRSLGSVRDDGLLELGMADSLAVRLSGVPGLVVRSTGSVLRYAGSKQDPIAAARELDVDWIVDGTWQAADDQVRATARLLRASDGSAAWSGSFDVRVGSVFEIQDRIADRVHQALIPTLAGSAARDATPTDRGGTRHRDAYQLYLAASWRGQGGDPASIQRAIELLEQALALDPGYAMAWTELAWAHRRRLWNADALPAEVFVPANQALARALALVPDLPHAHAGLGFTRFWYDFDWRAAESEFRLAVSRNASVVSAHWGLATLLLPQGRIEEGWRHLRQSRELDPMSPLFNTMEGAYLTDRGEFDEARRRLAISLDLAPRLWLTHVAQGQLLWATGNPGVAIASLRRAVEYGHGTSRPTAVLAAHLARAGERPQAEALLAELRERAAARYVPPTSLAMVHAALGDTGDALAALERAFAVRDARLIFLKDDPSWRPLRDEPRFVALRKQLRLDGLPAGLTPV